MKHNLALDFSAQIFYSYVIDSVFLFSVLLSLYGIAKHKFPTSELCVFHTVAIEYLIEIQAIFEIFDFPEPNFYTYVMVDFSLVFDCRIALLDR